MQTFHLKRWRVLKVVLLALLFTMVLYFISFHEDCEQLIRYSTTRKWTIATNVLQSKQPPTGDITMVTSMRPDQLSSFIPMVEHWKGPISLSVLTTRPQDFLKDWERHSQLTSRHDINLNFVTDKTEYYPRNLLTNVAVEHAQTDYLFFTDVGETPCPALYTRICFYIERMGLIKQRSWDQGLVVPVFEGVEDVPQNKSQVLSKLHTGQIRPYEPLLMFHSSRMTNFAFWETASNPYEVYYIKGYSPNLVLKRAAVPTLNIGMIGRDFDKLSFHAELYVAGVRLTVLPDVYSFRQLYAAEAHLEKPPDIKCIAIEFKAFREQLERRYCHSPANVGNKTDRSLKNCRKQQVWDMVAKIVNKAYN